MVSFKTIILAAAAGLMAPAAAEYLGVVETAGSWLAGQQCHDQAKTYGIVDFGNSLPGYAVTCSSKGKVLSTNNSNKAGVNGCSGEYTNGYRVCGTNIHNGKGYHQECYSSDVQIFHCPVPTPCWTSRNLRLSCRGVWIRD